MPRSLPVTGERRERSTARSQRTQIRNAGPDARPGVPYSTPPPLRQFRIA